ncbi:serine/threonine-protein kinase haspin, partial [Biomphalaria glabrata]
KGSPFGTSNSDSSHIIEQECQESNETYTNPGRRKKLKSNCSSNSELHMSDHQMITDDSHEKFSLFTEFTIEKRKTRAPLKDVNSKTLKKRETKKKTTAQKEKRKNASLSDVNIDIPDFDSIEKDELIIDCVSPMLQSSSTPVQIITRKSTIAFNNLDEENVQPISSDKSNCEIDLTESCNLGTNNSKLPVNVTYRHPKNNICSPEPTKLISNSSDKLDSLSFVTAVEESILEESSDDFQYHVKLLSKSLHELELAKCLNSTMNSPALKQATANPVKGDQLDLSNISADLFEESVVRTGLTLECIEEEISEVSLEKVEEVSLEEVEESEVETESEEEEYESSLLIVSDEDESLHCRRSTYVTSKSFSEKLAHSLLDTAVPITAEEKVLALCGQTEPVGFYDCIPRRVLSKSVKIGEGVYGEVFKTYIDNESMALKIIPIEGDIVVNDCPQKKFEEILPEIVIAQELSNLALNESSRTVNFCQVRRISCVKGEFPKILLDKWDEYALKKSTENDRPDKFTSEQLFIMFEFYNGGCALEKFKFGYPLEIFSTLRQVVFALAVAEESLEFEHRDLHIGNILVKPCLQDTVSFKVLGIEHQFPTESVMATIIDFTISRLKKDGCAVFCDVASDDGLFEGTGDFQFDVYRDMKKENGNDWQKFTPRTNIMWVNYLCQKLMITLKKRKDNSRLVRSMKKKLQDVLDVVLQYDSCLQLTLETELWS